MNYEQYVKHQTFGVGMIKKPLRYRVGERLAIDYFFQDVPKSSIILDVGCGSGTGLAYLKKLGYLSVRGIELNPLKVEMCRRKGLNIFLGDIEHIRFPEKVDVIWCSHSFEHVWHPDLVIENLKHMLKKDGRIFFILPYPDTGPKEVHCASDIIGTRKDDDGAAVVKWFYSHGLNVIEKKFDAYRENEIWLKMVKGTR